MRKFAIIVPRSPLTAYTSTLSSSPLHPTTSITTPSRGIIAIFLVCVGLGLTLVVSLTQGTIPLSFAELQQALWHQGSSINQTIVWDLRLPRIIAALMVGSALGLSGALLQGMLRNGLADPFILGISGVSSGTNPSGIAAR